MCINCKKSYYLCLVHVCLNSKELCLCALTHAINGKLKIVVPCNSKTVVNSVV